MKIFRIKWWSVRDVECKTEDISAPDRRTAVRTARQREAPYAIVVLGGYEIKLPWLGVIVSCARCGHYHRLNSGSRVTRVNQNYRSFSCPECNAKTYFDWSKKRFVANNTYAVSGSITAKGGAR